MIQVDKQLKQGQQTQVGITKWQQQTNYMYIRLTNFHESETPEHV